MVKVPENRNSGTISGKIFFSVKRKFPEHCSGITDRYGIPELLTPYDVLIYRRLLVSRAVSSSSHTFSLYLLNMPPANYSNFSSEPRSTNFLVQSLRRFFPHDRYMLKHYGAIIISQI